MKKTKAEHREMADLHRESFEEDFLKRQTETSWTVKDGNEIYCRVVGDSGMGHVIRFQRNSPCIHIDKGNLIPLKISWHGYKIVLADGRKEVIDHLARKQVTVTFHLHYKGWINEKHHYVINAEVEQFARATMKTASRAPRQAANIDYPQVKQGYANKPEQVNSSFGFFEFALVSVLGLGGYFFFNFPVT